MQNFFYNQYMITFRQYIRQSTTCKIFNAFYKQFVDFVTTLGTIVYNGFATLKYICLGQINLKELMDQCVRFGISSLPITLSIVGMTSIIVTSQVAAEMVKQVGVPKFDENGILKLENGNKLKKWIIKNFGTS